MAGQYNCPALFIVSTYLPTYTRKDDTMSIADEIRKAMAELNLNTEDVPTTDPEPEKEKEPEQEYTLTKDDQLVKLTPAERLIMKQQQELDNPQPETHTEPATEPVKKPKAPKAYNPPKPKKEKTQPVINVEPKVSGYNPSEPVQERPQPEPKPIQETPQKSPTIYMKVAGDKLVVMIPDGVELEHHNINGESVRAAVVSLPDLSDNELQVLDVINKVETEPVKHTITQHPAVYVTQETTPKAEYEFDVRAVADPNWTPDQATPIQVTSTQTKTEQVKFEKPVQKIEKPKTEKHKPVLVPDENLNLDDLLEEKKTLTAEIKEAREAGDTERVNMLRRQRRVVRAKIHQCGG